MFRVNPENITESSLNSNLELYHLESAKISFAIRQFILPLICVLGIIGNTLSVSTFLRPVLRDYSCSILLATRSLSDNGFLLTVFIVWLDFINLRIFHVEGVCQLTLFLSYICGFMSVWCVVLVTTENYIRICHPLEVTRLCTIRRAVYALSAGVLLACVMYNFPLWAAHVEVFNGKKYCLTKSPFRRMEIAMTYMDTVLTLLIPLIIILFFMVMIVFGSFEAKRRHDRLKNQRTALLADLRRTESPYTKVTLLLFIVTCSFLILHTPSHVIRLKVLIENFGGKIPMTSETDRIVQQLFQILYYLNFSINILIYLCCGNNFRKVFLQTFCNKFSHSISRLNDIQDNEDLRSAELVMKELATGHSDP